MTVFSEIIMVSQHQWPIMVGMILAFCLGAIFIYLLLVTYTGKRLNRTEYFAISLAGSPSVLFIFLFIISLVKFPVVKMSMMLSWLPTILLALLFVFLLFFNHEPAGWFVLIFLVVSLLLRMPFIARVLVPPYFDSVEHSRLVKTFLQVYQGVSWKDVFQGLTDGYYHMGFHLFAAGMSFVLQGDPIKVILWSGQFALTLIPLPIFFLVRRVTQDTLAALFGMLLAAFGWYMPSFALNWGKYPALSALLPFGFALSLVWICIEQRLSRAALWRVGGMLIIGALTTILTHSRTAILFVFSVLAWGVAGFALRKAKLISALLLLIVLTLLGKQVWDTPLLHLALRPYINGPTAWSTFIVALLLPFAFQQFPRLTFFNLLFTILLLSALFVPLGNLIPGQACQTLLDRPFVEMSLFFPLSLQGGIGLAGLSRALRRGWGQMRALSYATFTVFFGAVILLAGFHYNLYLYPSSCCVLMRDSDAFALGWLKQNLPLASTVVIASAPLSVVPQSCPVVEWVGSDAGLWIPLLTSRSVYLLPYDTDFRSKAVFERLCQLSSPYIYVGSTDQSFRLDHLAERKGLYQLLLSIAEVRIYRLECKGSQGDSLVLGRIHPPGEKVTSSLEDRSPKHCSR